MALAVGVFDLSSWWHGRVHVAVAWQVGPCGEGGLRCMMEQRLKEFLWKERERVDCGQGDKLL